MVEHNVLIKNQPTNQKPHYNHICVIENYFSILFFFPGFSEFDKYEEKPNSLMFVCTFSPFPVEVLKGESLIQGLAFIPFSSGNGMRKGKEIRILLKLIKIIIKKKNEAFKRTKKGTSSECCFCYVLVCNKCLFCYLLKFQGYFIT